MQYTHMPYRPNRAHLLLLLLLALLALASAAPAAFAKENPVRYRVETFQTQATNGVRNIIVGIWITPQQGYHFYANNPGDTGRPTEIIPKSLLPDMTILYPKGTQTKDVFDPTASVMIHEGETPFFIRFPATDTVTSISFSVTLLLCSDSNCWPVQQSLTAAWTSADTLPLANDQPWWKDLEQFTAITPAENGTIQTVGETSAATLAAELGVQLPSGSGAADSLAPSSPAGNTLSPQKARTAATTNAPTSMRVPQTTATPQLLKDTPPERAVTNIEKPTDSVSPFFNPTTGYTLTPRYHLPSLEVTSLGTAILFGLLAGFILNFMPCVLPVISLKLSALVSASSVVDERQRIAKFRQHNIWFAVGVMVWFAALAAILSVAEKAWGQIFQDERLVTGLMLIVFLLGLSIFGVFELPMLNLKGNTNQENGRKSAFYTGLLATLLATPCSGPFLGGVLGWAFLQPAIVLSVILLAVGLGMASPYLCLAVWPGLVRHFPKPGAWTITLQHLVGFFLMGTAGYLLTVLPSAKLPDLLILLWVTALAAWIWGQFAGLNASPVRRWTVRILCILMIAVPLLYERSGTADASPWKPFEQQQFLASLGKQNIMMDFSADWCPNCKILEHTVLTDENRARWAAKYNIVFIKVDLTRSNEKGQALLSALGSQSIPVVALFPAGDGAAAPIVLRDLFTTDVADAALQEAFGN